MAFPPSTLQPVGLRHGRRHCIGGDDPIPCLLSLSELDFGDEGEHCEEVSFDAGQAGVRKTVKILKAWQIDLNGRLWNLLQTNITASLKTSNANIRAMVFFVARTTPLALGADFRVNEIDTVGGTKYVHMVETDYVEDTSAGGGCEGQDNPEIELNQRIYFYIGLVAQCVPNTEQSGTVCCRRVYLHGLLGRISAITVI